MPITISIVKSPVNTTNSNTVVTFAENGGTIGRGVDNNWTLEDPERFISTTHSQVKYENGQFYLLDLSTNGTFHNGSDEPIGKGNKVALTDGDKFSLSEYEFHISLEEDSQNEFDNLDGFMGDNPFDDFNTSPQDDDIFGNSVPNQVSNSFSAGLPGYSQASDPLFAIDEVEADPLIALDKARGSYESEQAEPEAFSTSYAEQSDVMSQSIAWPNPVPDSSGIPDDWDDDLDIEPIAIPENTDLPLAPALETSSSVQKIAKASFDDVPPQPNHREHELEVINKALLREIEQLKKQAGAPQTPVTVATGDARVVVNAMGIEHRKLNDDKIAEINRVVGEVVRETIAGMMQVLSSRNSIKNEFRMNVTTIQPVENNPLKFSANIDDALENMFIKEGNAYKKPVEAIREGFLGIGEHQVAILAGIRSAFKGVIERFDPVTLEQRFEKYRKSGLIQVGSKGKNWDAYQSYYNELVEDLDNSFQHLFGYEFVQAYEDQLQRLAVSRKGI